MTKDLTIVLTFAPLFRIFYDIHEICRLDEQILKPNEHDMYCYSYGNFSHY